jgi:hypothetical protein
MTERYLPHEAEDGLPLGDASLQPDVFESGWTVEGQPAEVALSADAPLIIADPHPRLRRLFTILSTAGTSRVIGKYQD